MALLKYLVYLQIVLFPILEVGRLSFSNGVNFTINDILASAVFLTTFFLIASKKIKLQSKLTKEIAIFLGIGFLSLLVNILNFRIEELVISSLYLIRWVIYSSIYLAVINLPKNNRENIQKLLFFAGSVVLFLSIIQYFFYQNLRNLFYLGWDEHLYRLFGSFLDPNFAGIFISIFSVYLLGQVISKKYSARVLFLLLFALSLVAVTLTYSRSALLTLMVCLFSFFILLKRTKIFLILLLFMILAITFSPKAFKTEGTNLLRIASTNQRLESMENAIKVFEKNPILGVGFNTYRYAQYKYGYLKGEDWKISHSGAGVENSYLFLLATTGILGTITYIFLIRKIYLVLQNSKNNIYKIISVSSFIGLLISGVFINSLFYPPLMLWMWVLIGLTQKS